MSEIAVRCEGIGKQFLFDGDPHHGLRAGLSALLPWGARPPVVSPRWALRDVSFEAQWGKVIGVLGRNGSGKSVLLKILARVTKPTAGRSTVFGSVGSILHLGSMLVPELTGRENIFQVGTLMRLSGERIDARFDEIVAFSGIESDLDALVRTYSAGMQLRLAFAVCAYLDSDVLLIDEALSVADREFRGRCMTRIREMAAEGRTVLLVSHEMDLIAASCDEVLVLDRGHLVAQGDAPSTIAAYFHPAQGESPVERHA